MELTLVKTKKSVPNAEQLKQEQSKPTEPEQPQAPVLEAPVQKQEVPPTVAAEKPIVVSAPLKNILTRINSMGALEKEMLDRYAIPLKDMADWMFMMEQTLRQVPTVTEKGIAEELKKSLLAEAQKQQPASTGNVGGSALGGIMQALPQLLPLLTGGGSSDIQNKIMDMAIESMGLGNALVRAIIVKTAPELATNLLKPFEKKEG